MKWWYYRAICIICLILSINANSLWAQQEPLEAVDTILSHHPRLQMYDARLRSLEHKRLRLRVMPQPSANLQYFALPIETRLGTQRWSLQLNQPIPWPGLLHTRAQAVEYESAAVLAQKRETSLTLHTQWRQSLHQLWYLREKERILRENIDYLHALKALAQARMLSGKRNAADVLRVDLKISELEKDIQVTRQQVQQTRAALIAVLGTDRVQDVAIPDSIDYQLPDTVQALQRIARHPRIVQLQHLQQQTDVLRRENHLAGMPQWQVGLMYASITDPGDIAHPQAGRDVVVPSIRASLPLYRQQYRRRDSELNAQYQTLQWRVEDTYMILQSQYQQAITRYREAAILRQFYQDQIQQIKAIIRILQSQYSGAGSEFDELLLYQIQALNYEIQMHKALKIMADNASIVRYLLQQ